MEIPLLTLPDLSFAQDVADILTANNFTIKHLDEVGGRVQDLPRPEEFIEMCDEIAAALRRPHLKPVK